MKLLFLGTCSGLGVDTRNFQSNMLLLSDSGKKLLVDCGTDIRFSLASAQYTPQDIDAVYISHLHADHVGGLGWFAIQRKFAPRNDPPKLIIHEKLVNPIWDNCLSGGLKTLNDKEATLSDYFALHSVKDGDIFTWEDVRLNLIKTNHVHSNKKLMPSYGLEIGCKGKTFFLTSDAEFTPELFEKCYRDATLIFQDCEILEKPSGVHAHFNQLDTLDSAIKAKMWLYHYNDGQLPDAKSHGFLGFARCGQEIDLG